MNKNDLYKSFHEIDDRALLQTEQKATARPSRSALRILAASLALVLCAFGVSALLGGHAVDSTPLSWFVITAYAADGTQEELGLNDGGFNSGPVSDYTLFDTDAPLFSFDIRPSDRSEGDEIYSNYYIAVSCDGKSEDFLGAHVATFHIYYKDGTHGCTVMGWLEEPTDILISIVDAASDAVIEEQTVHVRYDADAQAYELTLTDVQTNDEMN